jgi:K+-transporting ATPase ATPase C chain
MFQHLRACLWLLVVTVVLCCVVYPLVLLGIGKAIFPAQAEGSLIERGGKEIGSRLIAQPFNDAKYFKPRPSAASYNAAASAASNLAGNNYLLRDRVARQLGPIVTYAGGPKKGQPVGPDVESWFQKYDEKPEIKSHEKPGIVEKWASLHPGVVGPWLHDWVKADKLNAAYVAVWEAANPDDVAKWKNDNNTSGPKPEDLAQGLAVAFFSSFSKDHPGMFPGVAEYEKDGTTAKTIGPVRAGSDIQSLFFDLWLIDHADAELEKVPSDMVTQSGSGLDPHITLDNALWQLDHFPIAAAWAKASGAEEAKVREEIRKLLEEMQFSPLGRLVGGPLVNVLELNLALDKHFGVR